MLNTLLNIALISLSVVAITGLISMALYFIFDAYRETK